MPIIDWSRISQQAPTPVALHDPAPTASLPKADIVVITWTSAEWSALDHVFLNSNTVRHHYSHAWESAWHLYNLGAPASDPNYAPLWGYYRLVRITNAAGAPVDVLLFKADAHLAYAPWIDGLSQMMTHILEDARPEYVYSIGTAGGTSDSERLGDTVITNAGHLRLEQAENTHVSYNHTTVSCDDWFPSFTLVSQVEQQLLYPLNHVVNAFELTYLIRRLHQRNVASRLFGYDDLVNAPLQPQNLTTPRGLNKSNVALLTTDTYFIASGDDSAQYSALEMDDAVIGHVAARHNAKFAFVRNISDPLVPASNRTGSTPIPHDVRKDWSGLIYEDFGLYTSFNGALLTWATIAGGTAA
ncbi:MAG: hypothetical protein MI919_00455 [Holophagales bacterium]|nr:hypothetical protein [Holophagales bacterium]